MLKLPPQYNNRNMHRFSRNCVKKLLKHAIQMKKNLLLLSLFASILLIHQSLAAQNIGGYDPLGRQFGSTGQPAVPFLRIIPDARSGSMGDVGIALTPDANSIHHNASNLAIADNKWGASVNYTPWMRNLGTDEINLFHGAGYYQFGKKRKQAIGLEFNYFSWGYITFNFFGIPLGEGRTYETALTGVYSRQLGDKWAFGLSAKYITSDISRQFFSSNGSQLKAIKALAVDISTTYKKPIIVKGLNTNLTIGAVVSNIGNKVSYLSEGSHDFLPTNLGIGGAWEIPFNANHKLLVSIEFNKLLVVTPQPKDSTGSWKNVSALKGMFKSFSDAPNGFKEEMQEITTSMGIEYWLMQHVALRAGYFHENKNKGAREFYTIGGGIRYRLYGLNISYLLPTNTKRSPLDNTWRFSFLLNEFSSKVTRLSSI